MDLSEQITAAHAYLEQFDYDHYPDCFAAFETQCAPFFALLEGREPHEAAAELIGKLEKKYEALPRRDRKEALYQDRQVLALFLSPAAARSTERAAAFADALREQWNRKYPRTQYLGGSFEQILKGFDANLLGLPLRKSAKRR